ncbi:hypothetical protein [Kitasatospora sp. NPDC090308]|uniref:hypothetical protein n=1 Tax=Kitasatospora sp. NPDC090308 TaxID=3364082 RepID=UPI00380F95AC
MKRPALAVAATVLAAGTLLAGCGSTRSSDSPGSGSVTGSGSAARSGSAAGAAAGSPDAAQAAQQEYEQQYAQAVADHDRAFPSVARTCAGKPTAQPSPVDTPSSGPQPENPKYAENHAYLRTAPLNPAAQCRGEAHAARIAAEAAAQPPTGPEQAKALLTRLGYPDATVDQGGDGVHFTFSVPQLGPCLTGVLSDPPHIEVHGPYLEGGCALPKGGH